MSVTQPSDISYNDISFNNAGFSEILGDSSQVMVYGFQHCAYSKVSMALESGRGKTDSVQKVFDCSVGNIATDPLAAAPAPTRTTLEDREMDQILYDQYRGGDNESTRQCNRMCKAGLTNLVIENYKREKEGASIIPLIFVTDITGNEYPSTAGAVTSKDSVLNNLVTHGELRRASKLARYPNKDVADVAQKTFKFARLDVAADASSGQLEPIKAPWDDPTFAGKMAARSEIAKKDPGYGGKMHSWREQVNRKIEVIERAHA